MNLTSEKYRHRQKALGLKRVEVALLPEDVDLVRRLAKALVKGDQAAEALRKAIDNKVPLKRQILFKDWIADDSQRV